MRSASAARRDLMQAGELFLKCVLQLLIRVHVFSISNMVKHTKALHSFETTATYKLVIKERKWSTVKQDIKCYIKIKIRL